MQAPDEHKVVQWDGYDALYHPAVHRAITVRSPEGLDVPLYQQHGIHLLNGGSPPLRYHAGLSGGPYGQGFSLLIDDPQRRIVSVTVEVLKEAAGDTDPYAIHAGEAETVRFVNRAATCPPLCEE